MFVKYARARIEKVGAMSEVVGEEGSGVLLKVGSSVEPVANFLDDYIYIKSWAVSAGEVYGKNDNLDYFPKDELLRAYGSYVNTGFYRDHNNWDKRLAYGLNLDCIYTPKDFLAVLSAVKKEGLQEDQVEVVEGIKSGKYGEVSMG